MKVKVLDSILSSFLPHQYFFNQNELGHRNEVVSTIFERIGIDIEFVSENNVDDFNEVIYPIVNLNNLTVDNQNIFSDILQKYIKKGLKVFIFHLNECFLESEVFSFNEYCLNNNIDTSKIYLFVNNNKIKKYLSDMKSKINFYFPFYQSIEHSNLLQTNFIEPSDDDRNFLFMCHNNKMVSHRLATIVLLKENNILKDVDYSCVYFSVSHDNDGLLKRIETEYKTFTDSYNSIIQNGSKLSFYENEKFTFDEIDSPIINVTTFKNSYVNIVTETDFSEDVIHITEKSLKPFYYYQLPIFVAPHNHLSELRKIYGFDMFDDIIDHSYDSEEDPLIRMKLIFKQLELIKNNPDVIKDFYVMFKDRFINNNKIVCEIINKKNDLDYIKNIFI